MSTIGESSKAPIQPPLFSILPPAANPSTLFRPSAFLDRLCKWLSTVVGTDQLIMLIQFSLDIITHHMDTQTPTHLRTILNKVVPVFGIQTPKLPTSISPISIRLKKLSVILADVRIFLRLQGIIPTYQWLLATHASPSSDPTLATIAKLQTYANMLFFPLENAAYLASHDIIPMSKRTETSLWLWSARFWATHVALDLIRLYREQQIKQKGKEKETETDSSSAGDWDRRWWAQLIMNLAYAPQTIHWSIEGGTFRDVDLAYVGVIAGIASIYLGWPTS
jgi:hypothetical protein